MATALDGLARALGDRAHHDVPIGPLTTYRVGGAARLLVEADDLDDLRRTRDALAAAGAGVQVVVLGKGSNTLVADGGFDGLCVVLGPGFDRVAWADRPSVTAWAAAALPVLARQVAAAGLTGFEWAVGVPGSVGGALRMNAGGHGSDMAAGVGAAHLVDLAGGVDGVVDAATLDFGYRRSSVTATQVVAWARLDLAEGDAATSKAAVAEIVRWRREHQPGGQNAGSVFTNPPGDAAGRLVEAAGAKGLRIGSAHVSAKHANFVQADEGGSADDVLAVIRAVQALVEEHGGVHLETELRLVGFG